jgi:hypothetical protein
VPLFWQRLINDWNIQARGHGCEACGRSFSDREAYHTLLFEEKTDVRRFDICTSCWEQKYKGQPGSRSFLSYWQGVYEAPKPPADAIRKETAESLLRRLIERNDPHHIPASYILAVMLERKRLLKVKEQIVRDGQRIFIYEQPGTGDLFTIPDPNLHLDQLEEVQRDVAALLEHGLNPPAPPAEQQPAPAAVVSSAEPSS